MSEPSPATIYPRYCFHLSPTFNAWCFLRCAAIHGLDQHAGFEGEGFYFYKNLPIKWVRIVGVVVAIDEFYGRRVFTIDDSSGACIEANITVPVTRPTDLPAQEKQTARGNITSPPADAPSYSGIEVGTVVDVKGSLSEFRDQKQIKIEKMLEVRSTAQEITLWQKRTKFRRDVLEKPWTLRDRDIRRCRKEAERSEADGERRAKRLKKTSDRKDKGTSVESPRKVERTKNDEPGKISPRQAAANLREFIKNGAGSGKYDALGL